MNILGQIRKDGGACAKPSEPRSTQEPMGQTPMSPQGMSAEVRAKKIVDMLRQEPQPRLDRVDGAWLGVQIIEAIKLNEAAARADERKIVQHEYSATDLTIAIQERMEFRDQRDALIAAQPGERVKTWKVGWYAAIEKIAKRYETRAATYASCERPDLQRESLNDAATMRTLIAPEAQPVEPSEGEGTHG